jgi:Zn2+/Cd2+-exporting ATPase
MPPVDPIESAPDHCHNHEPQRNVEIAEGACCSGGAPSQSTPTPSAPLEIPAGMVRSQWLIAQMDCPTEEALIRKKLGGIAEISALEFNLMQQLLTVVHRAGAQAEVEKAIRSLGMTPEPLADRSATANKAETAKPWWPLAFAGIAAMSAEVLHWAAQPVGLVALVSLASIAAGGLGTYQKGWIALRNGNLNINALMSIAVTGALLIGQWPEAAMVMFLFTIAELIEAKSLERARSAIRGLMQLTPQQATVQRADGTWIELEARLVTIGSLVRVKPGARIALDGNLVAGLSSVDQAPITGESLPVEKAVGDTVFAGTINQAGSFDYRVSATADNSTLARIIHAVEEAQGSRAPTQRFVDQFARIYTPLVFALAVGVALLPPLLMAGNWFDWIYKALVLLVIACPCALVISTPVSIVSGLAAAARHGILIKGGVYLEEGRKLRWLALDKTGTITHGKPALTDTMILDNASGIDTVKIATSLAARSDHPVSRAIAEAGKLTGIGLLDVVDFSAVLGRGVRGVVGGVRYQLGNHRLIHELDICSPALEAQLGQIEKEGKSVIVLTDGKRALTLFAVADTVKDGSRSAIESLRELGIKTVMLTGDNPHTARAIAIQVGIDEALGDQLPEDKLQAVEMFSRTGKVGMVGDGINDAPALARADIGFAMGAAGTDTAIETADVALMDDDLGKVARFVRLSKATHQVLVQNIVLALSIKAIFLVLTLMGMGTMWMAVFADMGTSLLVVGNGLRLLTVSTERKIKNLTNDSRQSANVRH